MERSFMDKSGIDTIFKNQYKALVKRGERQLRKWIGTLNLDASDLVHLVFEKMQANGLLKTKSDQDFLNLAEWHMNLILRDRYRQIMQPTNGGHLRKIPLEDFKG